MSGVEFPKFGIAVYAIRDRIVFAEVACAVYRPESDIGHCLTNPR